MSDDGLKFCRKEVSPVFFQAATMRVVLSHLCVVHSSDPRFNVICGVDGCSSTFHTFLAFYSHIYRRYKTSGIIQWESNTAVTSDSEMTLLDSSTSASNFLQDDIYSGGMGKYLLGHYR